MTGTEADARVQDLARVHHRPLVRAMALICGSVAEAEDAVQEVFLALWQAQCRGEAIISPRAWLTTASTNRLRSGWRRRARQDKYLDNLALEPAGPDAGADLADAMALRAMSTPSGASSPDGSWPTMAPRANTPRASRLRRRRRTCWRSCSERVSL